MEVSAGPVSCWLLSTLPAQPPRVVQPALPSGKIALLATLQSAQKTNKQKKKRAGKAIIIQLITPASLLVLDGTALKSKLAVAYNP